VQQWLTLYALLSTKSVFSNVDEMLALKRRFQQARVAARLQECLDRSEG